MPVYVALLRAVNVGGAGPLPMKDLAAELTDRGFRRVRTLLQSGNVVLETDARSAAAVGAALERALQERFGLATIALVRSPQEWAAMVEGNPFPRMAEEDPAHLQVTLLKTAPSPDRWRALQQAVVGPEEARGSGRVAYITYPNGIGRSKVTPTVIERTLGTLGTSRNWNTVLKLQGLLAE